MSGPEPQANAGSVLADPTLPVLAYAYARGILDADEIAKLCHSDPLLRQVANGVAFSGSELKSFRHRDRGLLVKLIVQLLIKATRQQYGITGAALPPALRRIVQDSAVDRVDSARHIDRGDEA